MKKVKMRYFIIFLATSGGVGFSSVAPGTLGSLVGILFAYGFSFFPNTLTLVTLLGFIFFSIWICSLAESYLDEKDSPKIVLDEICGMMISLIFVPWNIQNIVIAFLLFRFFDIVKVPPANFLEKNLPGGYGIVLDDVMAGLYVRFLFALG